MAGVRQARDLFVRAAKILADAACVPTLLTAGASLRNTNQSIGGIGVAKIFWVSPISGDWDVRCGEVVLSHHGHKRDAVRVAAGYAQADRPSVVKIQRRDGSLASERRYPSP